MVGTGVERGALRVGIVCWEGLFTPSTDDLSWHVEVSLHVRFADDAPL